MDILVRIKRCAIQGNLHFTAKARDELLLDGLTLLDVREALINARTINKVLRSHSLNRSARREYLYVIIAPDLSGTLIYTKGKLVVHEGIATYYLLISSKISS
jgi:hypothetical protein